MLDELRQIAIFAKIVDHGYFRAAAKALQLSPSVASHHVGQLEERLGTALPYRAQGANHPTLTRHVTCIAQASRMVYGAHDS